MRITRIVIRERATGRILESREFKHKPRRRQHGVHAVRPLGLGDAVERVVQPLARLSDRVLKTKLAGCSACSRRRAWLNQVMPDVRRPWQLSSPQT